MGKFDQYRAERKKGKSYREIAELYGVSYQTVAQACRTESPAHFHPQNADNCVYKHIRDWMNSHKISVTEMTSRMGYETSARNREHVRHLLNGDVEPRLQDIQRMIRVTGLNFERLTERG